VYIIHRPHEIMQRAPRLSTLLRLPSQPTQNMIEDPTALPGGCRTPHPSRLTQTLRLHGLFPHAPTTTLRERRLMPSDGEVDDGLTDWWGHPCCWACSCCCHCCCWCCWTRAATRASCSVKPQTTRAAILWWVVVLLSSPAISIPNSCCECEI
jgi:hypothetical protein